MMMEIAAAEDVAAVADFAAVADSEIACADDVDDEASFHVAKGAYQEGLQVVTPQHSPLIEKGAGEDNY